VLAVIVTVSPVTGFEFDFDGVDDSDLHTYAGADDRLKPEASTVRRNAG